MVSKYIPKQGDIVFIDFDPTKGHEQKGYRPGVVMSNNAFNKNTRMCIVCPITSNEKYFPTHYQLQETKKVHGSVLCEHIRSIDYDARILKLVEKTTTKEFEEIKNILDSCINN